MQLETSWNFRRAFAEGGEKFYSRERIEATISANPDCVCGGDFLRANDSSDDTKKVTTSAFALKINEGQQDNQFTPSASPTENET